MLWEEPAFYEARGMDFARAIASPDQRSIAYMSEATDRPSDLYVADSTFSNVRRMTTLAPALSKYAFGKGQVIDYTDGYGKPSKAALLLPSNYVKGRRYPVVIWIYASTLGSNQINVFGLTGTSELNCQMYATRGYAVLFPNIPVHSGTPMRDIMKAIMPATDRIIALGIADPNRLAVAGVSNGGYSTFATIVQTNRFKAAISSVGFGNLIAMYGESEFPIGIDESVWKVWLEASGGSLGVAPWQSPETYVRNSPVFYLNRVHTPVLMEGGSIDYAIISMTDEMFTDLKTLGKDVIYLRYDGEGHGLTQEPNLVDFWNRQLAFLEEHLGTH
jgi:dipeptidyl aminopeptidase/acylaminoacyl peptidase